MQQDKIRKSASDFAAHLLENIAVGHKEEITSDWLMEKHPALSKEEAEKYRLFCKSKTIVFKGCYGSGDIMWQKWIASNIE